MRVTVSVNACIDRINIDRRSVKHGQSSQVQGGNMPTNGTTATTTDSTTVPPPVTATAATATKATPAVDVPRGLAGVVVTDTALGDVRGQEGFYHYRQYSAVELAQTRSFEDVWHLMIDGELPDAARSADFAHETAELRVLPGEVRAALPAIARAGAVSGPLAGLRTALSLFGASQGFRPVYDIDAGRRR